jgi:hypothetical protein
MGILRQAKGMPKEVVDRASGMVLANRQLSSKYFGFALKQVAKDDEVPQSQRVVDHGNIRGAAAFLRGGVRNA